MVDPAWVALSLTRHLGGKTFRALLQSFEGDIDAILRADAKRLRQVPGIGPKIAQTITEVDVNTVEKQMRLWQAAGVQMITITMPTYPSRLKAVEDAPPTLFALGQIPCAQNAYAVIGTRRPGKTAGEFAANISTHLAEQGCVVVSGLAMGIDYAAHLGVLAVQSGYTVAVLGSGVLNIYPEQHQKIAQTIIDMGKGALICEVAPHMGVSTPGLVARNRIITGLCKGVIVVETAVDGGAMHAARFAKAQGVPLYTLDINASGNQALIQGGASVIQPDLSNLPSEMR